MSTQGNEKQEQLNDAVYCVLGIRYLITVRSVFYVGRPWISGKQ